MENAQPKEFISSGMRDRGLLFLGALLIVGPGILAVILGPSLLHPGSSGFTGTRRDGIYGLMMLALLIIFGLNLLVGGMRASRKGAFRKWNYAIGALLLMLIWTVVKNTFADEPAGGDSSFAAIAEKINRQEGLPHSENGVRMERVSTTGRTLHFTFTLTGVSSTEAVPADIPKMLDAVKKQTCEKKITKDTIRRGGSFHMRWVGNDGKALAEVLLTNGTCEGN